MDTQAEINALVLVYEEAVMRYNTTNGIIMGDMNADCTYLSNRRYNNLTFTNDDRFVWLIGKENDTTVTNSTCAYDRFVVTREVNNTLVQGSVLIFLFDSEYNLTQSEALDISDHYPIELQLEGSGVSISPSPSMNPSSSTSPLLTSSTSSSPSPELRGGDRPKNDKISLLFMSVILLYTILLW